MDTKQFLDSVITTPEGWFQLLIGPSDLADRDGWTEEWYEWPRQIDLITTRANEAAPNANIYFSSHLFETKRAVKENVLPSATIQCDLDDALIPIENPATILVETSPDRHQGYWILREPLQPDDLELLSRQLTYSIPDADRSGWSLGHKMRLPGTFNHKYTGAPKNVRVISNSLDLYKEIPFTSRARIDAEIASASEDSEPWKPVELPNPRQLWVSIRGKLPRAVVSKYDHRQTGGEGRSGALWALILACLRANLDRDVIFTVAKHSANNKFKDNKYHADSDLAKDILRAERALRQKTVNDDQDVRSKILTARRLPGLASERKQYIAAIVLDSLAATGFLVETTSGQEWFVREDTGRPIPITRSNDYLNSLLELRFGLNASEPEQRYVVNHLIATTKERGRSAVQASLSYYASESNALLVHTGRRDVIHATGSGVSVITNGSSGVLFPWDQTQSPFNPDLDADPNDLDLLFDGCFDNLDGMSPEQALALAKTWLVFMLFRNDAVAKPILALLGQPGSGKSTFFRKVYAFLYGPSKALNSITTADDFDHAVANDPLVVWDNVDTFSSWLPDKLALSAASSDLVKRKLYTDSDTIVLRRQALVGITAHNPKFRREDIVDRLLMFNFHRLPAFGSDAVMMEKIATNRNRLWGALINAGRAVLRTPVPSPNDVPNYRINDFARIGLRIARALGYESDFREALATNVAEQVAFNIEEEDILIDTIKIWQKRNGFNPEQYYSPAELFSTWSGLARDSEVFNRQYKNSLQLGRKLWALQDTLKAVFPGIDYTTEGMGGRKWRIK